VVVIHGPGLQGKGKKEDILGQEEKTTKDSEPNSVDAVDGLLLQRRGLHIVFDVVADSLAAYMGTLPCSDTTIRPSNRR
jgi:hypothetical protein